MIGWWRIHNFSWKQSEGEQSLELITGRVVVSDTDTDLALS